MGEGMIDEYASRGRLGMVVFAANIACFVHLCWHTRIEVLRSPNYALMPFCSSDPFSWSPFESGIVLTASLFSH